MKLSDRSQPAAFSALIALLQGRTRGPSAEHVDDGLVALRARISRARSPHRALARRCGVAASLVSCTLLVVLAVSWFRGKSGRVDLPVAMSRIEGGEVLGGGYLSEAGAAGIKLSFSEGSEFVLAHGTRGRLRRVTADGASLVLDRGTASFQITPSHAHRWTVEAGPFVVTVTGTQFSVSWDPEHEQFAVTLRRGRVTVRGPLLAEEMVLEAGHKLSVSLPRGEAVITQDPPKISALTPAALPTDSSTLEAPAPPDSAASAPGSAGSAGSHTEARTPVSPRDASTGRHWDEALAKGDWDLILADVARDGLAATLQTASSRDLVALADAARYRRRSDWARAALLAQRERFAGSHASLNASFLLGRVEESAGRNRQAIQWYDTYLLGSPTGTYAAEALGRKMVLSKALDGSVRARDIAEEYLSRFPDGSYAGTARALRAE